MKPLEPPDSYYLSAAQGWLELGNASEAARELAAIRSPLCHHPDVLETRWVLNAQADNWDACLELARALVEHDPERAAGWIHQAYTLRRVKSGGLQAAWDALLPAAEKFAEEPTIPYNLSCYAAQLGRLEDARKWLHQALDRAHRTGELEHFQTMARQDPDLEPLRRPNGATSG